MRLAAPHESAGRGLKPSFGEMTLSQQKVVEDCDSCRYSEHANTATESPTSSIQEDQVPWTKPLKF